MLLFLHTSPKKTSPAAARRRGAFIRIYAKQAGGGWGSSRKGRFGGDCLSERGGPSKVFPGGIYLPPRRVSPRSVPALSVPPGEAEAFRADFMGVIFVIALDFSPKNRYNKHGARRVQTG